MLIYGLIPVEEFRGSLKSMKRVSRSGLGPDICILEVLPRHLYFRSAPQLTLMHNEHWERLPLLACHCILPSLLWAGTSLISALDHWKGPLVKLVDSDIAHCLHWFQGKWYTHGHGTQGAHGETLTLLSSLISYRSATCILLSSHITWLSSL